MAQNDSQSTWKDKAKHYGKIALIIAIAIWFFNIAQGAQKMAKNNKEFVKAPNYEISYVPGGPKRFESEFKEISENTDKKIKADNYLWSTVIVKNKGGGAGQQIKIKDVAAFPIAYVGYSEPGYGYTDIKLKHKQGAKKATINLESLETDQNFFIFVAMKPTEIKKPYDKADFEKWMNNYENYQQKIVVESDQDKEVLYGDGLSKAL